jgi:hypothetical protein
LPPYATGWQRGRGPLGKARDALGRFVIECLLLIPGYPLGRHRGRRRARSVRLWWYPSAHCLRVRSRFCATFCLHCRDWMCALSLRSALPSILPSSSRPQTWSWNALNRSWFAGGSTA